MTSTTYTNPITYTYDTEHSGAHYFFNGKYANCGEFLESVAKAHRGLDYTVNPTTSFDKGSDIESEKASVKSGGASLACLYGDTKEEIIKEFFERVASEKFIYITMVEDNITEYEMNKTEFKNFLDEFGTLAKESGGKDLQKVRIRKTSTKMVKWFEERT